MLYSPWTLAGLAAIALVGPAVSGSIDGRVNGPDGKPFMGAFVVAENAKTRMTVSVLSDEQGRYRFNDLADAVYSVKIAAIGYKAESPSEVRLAGAQTASYDFALQKRPVRWGELTTYQGRMLLPKSPQHSLDHGDRFFTSCFQSCHSFQQRMTSLALDEAGWRDRVRYMNDTMMAGYGHHLGAEDIDDFSAYLTAMFGANSSKPASPEELPAYKTMTRPFGPTSMNIVYVEYEFPAADGMGPWSAIEDRDGMIWVPYNFKGNSVARLNPETAEVKFFKLPFTGMAAVHSVVPAPDGTVWFVELARRKIAHLDPATGEMTEFDSPPLPDGKKTFSHTIRLDALGRVWTSGGPAIQMFDPKTRKFQHFELAGTYGNETGLDGDQWFTSFRDGGPIGRVSKDGVLTTFQPPTNGKPQRLQIDTDGMVYFSERQGNKIGRLDAKTGTFREFALPGPEASPYAIGIDLEHRIWYSSHEQDTLGRLDPNTGDVTEYPYPHAEISMRELHRDSRGRMWYANSVNNKIGYFYLTDPAKAK